MLLLLLFTLYIVDLYEKAFKKHIRFQFHVVEHFKHKFFSIVSLDHRDILLLILKLYCRKNVYIQCVQAKLKIKYVLNK